METKNKVDGKKNKPKHGKFFTLYGRLPFNPSILFDVSKGPGFPYLRAGMEAGAQWEDRWVYPQWRGMKGEAGVFVCCHFWVWDMKLISATVRGEWWWGERKAQTSLLENSPFSPVTDWMCVSSQNSYIEALTSNVVIWRWGLWEVTGVRWSHEGGTLRMGLVPF